MAPYGTLYENTRVLPRREPSRTHPVPEHIGGVPPTVLVVLLAAAIRNHILFEGLVPVGVRDDTAALPLRKKHTSTTHRLCFRSLGSSDQV